MLRSLFSGVSGLDANQELIDTIGNDIANINTTGYKSNEVQFEDLLDQTITGATAPTSSEGGVNPTQVGLGVKVAGIEANFTQGTSEQTGNPLDLSIQGNGFFIANANGQTVYTQAGSLELDGSGNLVTPGRLPGPGLGRRRHRRHQHQCSARQPEHPERPGDRRQRHDDRHPRRQPGPPVGLDAAHQRFGRRRLHHAQGASTSVTVYSANGSTESLDLNFEQAATLPSGAPKGAASAWTVEGVLTEPGGTPDYTNATTATLYFDEPATSSATPTRRARRAPPAALRSALRSRTRRPGRPAGRPRASP